MANIRHSSGRGPRTRSKKVVDGETKHLGYDRRHRCTIDGCPKAFTRAEHLKRHQLNHNSPQVWNCSACSVTFVRKDLWQRHLKLSHQEHVRDSFKDATSSQCTSRPVSEDAYSLSNSFSDINDAAVGNSMPPTFQAASHRPGEGSDASLIPGEEDLQVFAGQGLDDTLAAFEVTWIQELEDWRSEFSTNKSSRFADTDVDWFFQNQYLSNPDQEWTQPQTTMLATQSTTTGLADISAIGENGKVNGRVPPALFQDLQSKVFVHKTGELEPPDCGFRICNALTEERRIELLMDLRNLTEIDHRDPIFSLNSMKHGIHLFCRNVPIEYAFVHQELLYPSCRESREAIVEVFGEESGPQLLWAAVTLGWALMRSDNNYESYMASKIQRAIRTSIINHPGLANTPPLWLVQTLFLVLLFARYQGTREEYGFASMFHGVLLEATRRLDYRSDRGGAKVQQHQDSGMKVWIKWIETEAIRRLILQTFALDVKNAILHGGEMAMTPFELNLRLPFSEDAWYAASPAEWGQIMSQGAEEPVPFLTMLRRSWNPRPSNVTTEVIPRGSDVILYGLISIARELLRREDNSLSNRSSNTLPSLGYTVKRSLETWEAMWKRKPVGYGLESFAWRNCPCMIRLAHTLYEIGPEDLQTVAGKEVIEGKRRGVGDYARSKRKLRLWVKHDRALLGVSYAASVIEERLNEESSKSHCHHCLWCLYLAALICWNFGFALTKTIDTRDLVQDGQVISMDLAQRECHTYLQAAIHIPHEDRTSQMGALSRPTGMLIVLIDFLKARCETDMIEESLELLTRMAGLSGLPSTSTTA